MMGYRQIVVGLPSTEFTANVNPVKNTRKKVLQVYILWFDFTTFITGVYDVFLNSA
jgi:hypothetical protein